MPTAYVLLNSDLGSDESVLKDIADVLADEADSMQFELQGVYGVYDFVLKITTEDTEHLRFIITSKIRKITKIQSTLTMMVIEEQEGS